MMARYLFRKSFNKLFLDKSNIFWSFSKSFSAAQACKSDNPVENKVALITGGSVGIGLSIARIFLASGAKGVVLGDIKEKEGKEAVCKLTDQYGEDKVAFLKTDVTSKKQLEKLFKCTLDQFKQLDIVVNNAGLLQDSKWELMVNVNIVGLVHGTLLGFEYMGTHKKGKGGVIVNLASILGLQGLHGAPIYTGTKHFVIGFGRSIGHEYYKKCTGVKVMTICPGVTDTCLISNSSEYGLKGFGDVGKILAEQFDEMENQPPDKVGCCIIAMLIANENGSIWVSEGNECYKIEIPDRSTFRCD